MKPSPMIAAPPERVVVRVTGHFAGRLAERISARCAGRVTSHARMHSAGLLALVAALAVPPPLMAAPASAAADAAEIERQYQLDRTICLSGGSPQDQLACLREAAAAREAARRGQLEAPETPAQLEQNQLARCDRLPAAERAACIARLRDEGTARGSVEGGGIYRELLIRERGESRDR
jgi:hypothetical protein